VNRRIGVPVAVAAVAALVPLTAWALSWPLARAAYLAPVIVVGAAAVLGLVILWGRVALESLRESRRPRVVLALWLAGIGLVFLLTYLGVELPRE
jgi:hypothetical protein